MYTREKKIQENRKSKAHLSIEAVPWKGALFDFWLSDHTRNYLSFYHIFAPDW